MKWPLLMFLTASLFFWGCSSTNTLAVAQKQHQAHIYNKQVAQLKLQQPETRVADSLFQEAETLSEQGKSNAAWSLYDRAAIYYRLALSIHTVEQLSHQLENQKSELQQTQQKLKAYQAILSKLNQQ